jgi:hypothetical protein
MLSYQDHDDGYTQLIRFSDGEHYEEIKEDLNNLLKLGVQVESITTDGHKSILKAIKKSIPQVIVQRCLVHIQRMCLLWLTTFPKHTAGIELRRLVLLLLKIKTQNDRLYWIQQLELWHKQHTDYLQEKTYNQLTADIGIHTKCSGVLTLPLKEPYPICFIICTILKYLPQQMALRAFSVI